MAVSLILQIFHTFIHLFLFISFVTKYDDDDDNEMIHNKHNNKQQPNQDHHQQNSNINRLTEVKN